MLTQTVAFVIKITKRDINLLYFRVDFSQLYHYIVKIPDKYALYFEIFILYLNFHRIRFNG